MVTFSASHLPCQYMSSSPAAWILSIASPSLLRFRAVLGRGSLMVEAADSSERAVEGGFCGAAPAAPLPLPGWRNSPKLLCARISDRAGGKEPAKAYRDFLCGLMDQWIVFPGGQSTHRMM